MTATLETVKAEHTRLAKMIADIEAQQSIFPLTVTFPRLVDGERHVGVIVSADGIRRHHIILLAGDNSAASQQEQLAWAKSIGGDLPDRCEGALLFATMKDEFKPEAYWLKEQHASFSDYAWCQGFAYGDQSTSNKSSKLRARAVRRLPI